MWVGCGCTSSEALTKKDEEPAGECPIQELLQAPPIPLWPQGPSGPPGDTALNCSEEEDKVCWTRRPGRWGLTPPWPHDHPTLRPPCPALRPTEREKKSQGWRIRPGCSDSPITVRCPVSGPSSQREADRTLHGTRVRGHQSNDYVHSRFLLPRPWLCDSVLGGWYMQGAVLEAAIHPPALGQLFSFTGSFLDPESRPRDRNKD